ncbi:MAG TPA: DUF2079 domain-containing protein [Actinomycetes bacterium]|jgi:uncharacterized membrane protein|nr:DUF2079 domain-containing protein [Actinomycetes bacterium]
MPAQARPDQTTAAARPPWSGRDLCWVGLLTALTATVHSLIAISAYYRFVMGSFDVVIFDQVMRSYASLSAPVSIVKGVHDGFGPNFSVLGDHFSPVNALLAPLYWIYDHPASLFVAQSVLFAAAVPIVWVAARRMFGRTTAYIVATAFALSFPLQMASLNGFHEVAFAIPLTALALERLQAGRYRQACLVALALLLVKEDMGLIVAVFGLIVAARGQRKLGLTTAGIGVGAFVLVMLVLIPAAGGQSDYYWMYDQLGSGPAEALGHIIVHPLDTISIVLHPGTKVVTLTWLFGMLGFAALGSPLVLLTLPLLAERLFSSNPNHWNIEHHYDAFLWPILLFAAMDTVARLSERRRWPGLPRRWAIATLVAIAAVGAFRFPLGDQLTGHAWRFGERERAAAAAVAMIPDGVTVEADNRLGPHLTTRTTVLLLDQTPRGADWVVVDTEKRSFPFESVAEQLDRLAMARADGFEVLFDRSGYVVLHRGGP